MSLIKRLLGLEPDERERIRPLWHGVAALARERAWYAEAGVEDSVPGRFDAITLVLTAVLLRMERTPALIAPSVRLTELFVEDMDGQLREAGIGDLVVGKHIGKLISSMGGRLGALREGLTQGDEALAAAIARNVTLAEGGSAAKVAARFRALALRLDGLSDAALLAGEIG
ncbi:MAG: ubiquinol-cytochrome C chaperone family protein [Sphingomonadales bacterium]|nr:ubiquinol-cytochrome C chaperone family protein [Sphingomonadales bacterium]